MTDTNRCGLGAGQQALADGIVAGFPDDLVHHLAGHGAPCPGRVQVRLPLLADYDPVAGRFEYLS